MRKKVKSEYFKSQNEKIKKEIIDANLRKNGSYDNFIIIKWHAEQSKMTHREITNNRVQSTDIRII